MIISALAEYYDRAVANGVDLPKQGLEKKEIPFLVEINQDGVFTRILDMREDKRAKEWTVPQNCGRTTNIEANLLWDNIEYALGCVEGGGEPDDKVRKRHEAFVGKLQALPAEVVSVPAVSTLIKFLAGADKLEAMQSHPLWTDLIDSKSNNVSFVYKGEMVPVCADENILNKIVCADSQEEKKRCIISGEKSPIARLHTAIKGVAGANTSGANIVSFNIPPFCSYGKEQGENSSVGDAIVFRYTTALNHLLRRDSPQKSIVGGTTVVFWSRKSNAMEANLPFFFTGSLRHKDNPNEYTERMTALFDAVHQATDVSGYDTDHFYILGLSPNAARIAIRFWHKTTVKKIAENIKRYFDDTEIITGRKRDARLSVYHILRNIAALKKMDNLSPLLAGQFVKAIIMGQPYPAVLLQAAVIRCRAEMDVVHERAAIIKACIISARNFSLSSEEKEKLKMLNPNQNRPAYVLGRLFAVLEKMQEEALPGINATIKGKYYGTASTSPGAVFSILLRSSNHHSNKLPGGRQIYFEKLKGEVVALLEADSSFPRHLTLEEQGWFALGYYHQRQNFFTKKEDKEVSND